MTKVTKASAGSGHNVTTLDTLSSWQLATGGGYLTGSISVQTAGSSDAVLSLYDGTSTSGKSLATFSVSKVGVLNMPNCSFGKGLFAQMSGTTAAVVQLVYTGNAMVF